MIVTLPEFIALVIEDGIKSANVEYADPAEKESLDGALKGFERCLGKNPEELRALLKEAKGASYKAEQEKAIDYWFIRCQEMEIEWVCNCLSVVMINRRIEPIMPPTISAALKANEIINKKKE